MPNLYSRNLDDIGMDEEENKRKFQFFSNTPLIEKQDVPRENFFSKLFRAPKEQTEIIDEFGLQKPVRQGLSPFAKILGVALPALYGAAHGNAGLGILSGINSIGAQAEKNYNDDKDYYSKMRQYKLQQSEPTSEQKNFEYYKKLPQEQKAMFDEYKTLTKSPYEGLRFDLAKDQAQYMKEKNIDEKLIREEEKQLKREKDLAEIAIPNYKASDTVRAKPDDVAKLRGSVATLNSIKPELEMMKSYIDQYGTFEGLGEGSGKMESLARSIQLKLKNLYELGAITGPDMAILEGQIMNPTGWKALFTRNKTGKAAIDEVGQSIENTVKSKMDSFGYTPEYSKEEIEAEIKRRGLK